MIDFTKPRPVTLDGATDRVFANLTPVELEHLKRNDISSLHHTFGMALRNGWGLWEKDNPIILDMKHRFNLTHADDCTGLIFAGVDAILKNKCVRLVLHKEAIKYSLHWLKQGISPVSGERIKKKLKKV